MQNGVLARRSADRPLERRRAAYAEEVRRLVDASFALIRDSGQLEPRVGEIVRAAGLSNQAFYRHFRSKDELLVTLLDEGLARLAGYLRHRMDAVASPEQKIRRFVAGLLEQALDSDAAAATRPFALSRMRLSELFPDEVRESERQLVAMLRETLEAAAGSGEGTELDPPRDAETLYNLAMGWMERALARPDAASRADAEHLIEFALRGLGLDRAPGG
jgi:AcrR family transcriptional regulator